MKKLIFIFFLLICLSGFSQTVIRPYIIADSAGIAAFAHNVDSASGGFVVAGTLIADSIDARTATIDTTIVIEILKPDADEGADIGRTNLRFNETYLNNLTADSIYTDTIKVDGLAILDKVDIADGEIDGTTIGANSEANVTGLIGLFTGNVTNEDTTFHGDTTGNPYIRISAKNLSFINNNQNMYMGYLSGDNETSAENNTFLGYLAGEDVTEGDNNSSFGYQAGNSLTVGGNNVFIGHRAGLSTITTSYNVFVGASSGSSSVNRDYIACLGYESGKSARNYGTYIGAVAGGNNTGVNNTALGYSAGWTGDGSSNLFLGHEAGYYETGSNMLIMDIEKFADEATARTSSLIYGDFNANTLLINGTLEVADSIVIVAGYITKGGCVNIAEDGVILLPDATTQTVLVWVDGQTEKAMCGIEDDGTVTSAWSIGNFDNNDTDGNLCVYDAGTQVYIKLRLNLGALDVCYETKYKE